LTTANSNIAIGTQALGSLTTGSNNIAIGYLAGETSPLTSLSNSNSIILGSNSKFLSNSGTNEIVIGNSITGNGNNSFKAGNTNLSNFQFGELYNNISPLTTTRTVTWQDKNGTVAMLDDIPTNVSRAGGLIGYHDGIQATTLVDTYETVTTIAADSPIMTTNGDMLKVSVSGLGNSTSAKEVIVEILTSAGGWQSLNSNTFLTTNAFPYSIEIEMFRKSPTELVYKSISQSHDYVSSTANNLFIIGVFVLFPKE
jgi:hypothetical protein